MTAVEVRMAFITAAGFLVGTVLIRCGNALRRRP